MRYHIASVLMLLCMAAAALPAAAQDPTPVTVPTGPQLTAIVVSAIGTPAAMLGSDGLVHLETDLLVTNAFSAPVTLTGVTILTPDGTLVL